MRFRRNSIYTRLLSHPVSIILMTCCFFDEASASRNPQYEACKQEICGNVSLKYPFWTKSNWCGLSGFQLGCDSGQPFMGLVFGHYVIQRSESIHYEQQFVELKGDDPDTPCLPDFRYSETPPPSTSRDNTEPGLIYLEKGVSNLSAEVYFFYHCNLTYSLPYVLPFNCSENGFHPGYVALIPLPGQEPQGLVTMKSACKYHYFVKVELETSDFNRVTKTIGYKRFYKDNFMLHWTDVTSEKCRACQSSGGECGQSGEDVFQCFCSDRQDPKSCTADGRRTGLSLGLPFGIGGTALLLLSTVGFLCWIRRGRTRLMFCKGQGDKNDRDIENLIKSYESFKPKRFSYLNVKRMTNSFREKLGQGGFGAVYKGELPDGTLVAVKLLNSSKGDGQEFINEVASISRTSHVNVVSLLGFCFEGRRRALIYEHMSNGSLDKFIYDDTRNLGWERLYHIAVGIARGLEYLHRGCSTRILHFDIKPQNILLDRDFCPKISDFGLSKLCLGRESVVSMLVARGTIGYIAPEVVSSNFGGVSHKSDVYSYGMMLIELMGVRKILDARADRSSEVYFHDQVYRLVEQWHEPGLAPGQVSSPEQNEIARKMAFVSLWCIQGDPSVRPSMSRVIEMLEGSMESLQIPPKPFLFSPAISRPIECSSSTS